MAGYWISKDGDMKKADLLCISCKNWKTDLCNTCLSITSSKKWFIPEDIVLKNYKEMPITCKEYKRRTGKKWADHYTVYVKLIGTTCSKEEINDAEWRIMDYDSARGDGYPIICAITQKRPPKKWLPKGYVVGSMDLH